MADASPARRRAYEILDVGSTHDPWSRRVHAGLVLLILVSVAMAVLQSVPSIGAAHAGLFLGLDLVAGAVFTVEYVLRLWAAVEHPPLRHLPAWRARLHLAGQPGMLIDLVAILPLYLALAGVADLQVLLLFRLARFFKLARYSPGLRSLIEAVEAERRALLACLVILGGVMIVAATAMHLAEQGAQPDKFGSIPESMYWAIITLTTVGYGDIHPITPAGRMVAAVTAVMGLVMLSLPVGIIATSFAEVIHRRDFVVTWNMVARVPLFAQLDAREIADIMRYLRSRMVEPGAVIVHRDDPADSMYFIADGAVEVELPDRRVTLEPGQFFGETALLRHGRRLATVRAVGATRLLVLDRADFQVLLDQNAAIARRIRAIHRAHAEPPAVEPAGDLARPEIEAAPKKKSRRPRAG